MWENRWLREPYMGIAPYSCFHFYFSVWPCDISQLIQKKSTTVSWGLFDLCKQVIQSSYPLRCCVCSTMYFIFCKLTVQASWAKEGSEMGQTDTCVAVRTKQAKAYRTFKRTKQQNHFTATWISSSLEILFHFALLLINVSFYLNSSKCFHSL